MSDYIIREALLEKIDGIWDCADMVFEPNDHCCRTDDCGSCKWRETKNAIRKIAATIPAADVRPVVRGEWFFVDELNEHFDIYCCKKCGAHKNFRKDELKPYFCEWCGADMREEGA